MVPFSEVQMHLISFIQSTLLAIVVLKRFSESIYSYGLYECGAVLSIQPSPVAGWP